MEQIQEAMARQPPPTSFTTLPLELRDMIYSLLIEEAIVKSSPPLSGIPNWQTPTFSQGHKFDLQISTKRVTHPNLRLPSNLIYTSQQINAEMNILICARIHHLKLTGDFMMGLSSTEAIFNMLERRPWISDCTRTVNIVLKLDHVLSFFGGVAVNSSVLEQHPWLGERLKIAELKVSKFEMEPRGMAWKPRGFWRALRSKDWNIRSVQGLGMLWNARAKLEDVEAAEARKEHNTLPDLARLFEAFPLLEKIDIETEHRHLLSLFPAPRVTAESFRTLAQRGIEVNVLVKHWQMQSFCTMLYRNGIERGTISFGDGVRRGKLALSYQKLPHLANRVVSFRLVDCMLRPDDEDERGKAISKWSRWVPFGGRWQWKKKKEDDGVIQDDAMSNSESEPGLVS